MLETIANALVYTLAAYAGLGVLFAALFITVGVQRLDEEARGSGVAFRLLILPGAAVFWPMFLSRWVRGVVEPPVERNPRR